MIYFTSDLHLDHDKDFIYKERGFDDIHSHNLAILNNWNSVVTPDDTVYVLGDLMLGDNSVGMSILKQLNGAIYIILGNHDTQTRKDMYLECPNIIEICYATQIKYKGYNFYLSHYPTLTANLDESAPIKARVINLCGHSHIKNRFKDMDKGLIYHVEIDCHNNFPISLDEILFDINHFISMDKNDQIDIVKKDIY